MLMTQVFAFGERYSRMEATIWKSFAGLAHYGYLVFTLKTIPNYFNERKISIPKFDM